MGFRDWLKRIRMRRARASTRPAPYVPFSARAARSGSDHAARQTEAALQSARHARSSARAAWASVLVNALVISTALFVPAYQHSLDAIENELADRRQAALALKAGYDGLLAVEYLLAPGGFLDQGFCQSATRMDALTQRRITNIVTNMIDDNRMRFKPAETEFTSGNQLALMTRLARDTSDAFDLIRNDIAVRAPLPERRQHCLHIRTVIAGDAEALRGDLIDGYLHYRRPLPRPFGFLNGAQQQPPPILMEKASWELDESARRVSIPIPVTR